jgi:L-ascorbate metabolism protein UlaG (beta-lactamase superfamily)
MKISKYIHSCLLFEHEGAKLLFDPGWLSFQEGRVTPDQFGDVSTVVLTHEHPDHLDVKALRQILSKSGATVIGNGEVAAKLQKEGIEVVIHEEGTRQAGPFTLRAIPAEHQPILSDTLPRNTAFLINERVLNPGDSFAPALLAWKGVELLVLPVMAPFLTELVASDFAKRMQPRQVLPVHDGYAKDFFLKGRYETYESFLKKLDIQFHALAEPGASVEV